MFRLFIDWHLWWLAIQRQGEIEYRPSLRPIRHPNASAVGLYDGTANGQPKTNAPSYGRLRSKELIEYLFLIASRHAGSVVTNGNNNLIAFVFGRQLDLGLSGCIFYGIFQKIYKHLFN